MAKISQLTAEQITSSENYERERLRIIFEYSPIAIWEEDFSAIADLKKFLQGKKVKDVRSFLRQNTKYVKDTFRKLKVLDVNKAALNLYGAKTKEELLYNLGKTIHKDAINVLADEFAALIEGKDIFEAVFKSKTLNGKLYDVKIRVSVPDVYKHSFKRVIVTLQDISVEKKYERHLKRLAQTDGLTGLLNHNAVAYRLAEEFSRAQRYHLDLSCLMIDLDDFKLVNDKLGHQKGNQVLKKAAQTLKSCLREVDVIGRYGGDEFLVILPETDCQSARIPAERLRKLFEEMSHDKKSPLKGITLSIGIGGRPMAHVKTAVQLVNRIDKAMYHAKKLGGNRIKILS